MSYFATLKKASEFCQFDDLRGEDDILNLKLISGLCDYEMKKRVLEANQLQEMNLMETFGFLQRSELIQPFTSKVGSTDSNSDHSMGGSASIHYVDKNKRNNRMNSCSYCGRQHLRGKCPAFGKTCNVCKKLNHFVSQCRTNKMVNALETSNYFNADVNEECYAIGDSKFSTIVSVLINNVSFQMQIDAGASLFIVQTNFRIKLGKPKLTSISKNIRMFELWVKLKQ
jgi:hypothetical protein